MHARTLFAGDVNIDIQMSGLRSALQTDREVFCDGFAVAVGGSTCIASWVYARLGGQAELAGLVGDDDHGRFLAARLREAGLGLRLLRSSTELPTGVTVNLVQRSTRTQVTYPGTLAVVDETAAILRELPSFTHLHVSGPYGTPRFLPRVAEVLAAARASGLTTSLDTQWDASGTWRHLDEWLPSLTYLFVNRDEALSITRETKVEAAWRELAGRTACPIVKLGPRGAYAAKRRHEAFDVEVVDPTGAGDAFGAAFLYAGHALGMAFDAALRFALAAGALACTYPGGVSELFSRKRVMEMLA
jgi:ribokinase